MQKELLKCGCCQASLDQVGQVEQQRRHVLRTKETTRAPSQPQCCGEHKGRESPTVTEATTLRGGRPRRLPAWSALVTQRFGVCGKPRPRPEASWPRPSALSWTWLPSRPSSLWPCGPLSAHVPRDSLSLLIVCRRTTLLSSTPAETPRAMRHRVSQKGGRAFAPSSWEVTAGPPEHPAGHWSRFLAGPFPPAPGQGLEAQMPGSDAHGGAESRSPARPAPRACRGVIGRAEGTKPHRRAPLLTGILGCGVNREV